MRIISGRFKSRRITAPKKLPVRPTTDRAKESLFNIINNEYYFEGLSVLDLFAGIGSISFEFASRGVENITAVDNNRGCIEFMAQTADTLGLQINFHNKAVLEFLNNVSNTFDIIFADPPYDYSHEAFVEIVDAVFENKLLSDKGVFILEHSKHTDLSDHAKFQRSRNYGHSVFSWFE
jgi:16S rRNA (guanine(966)-N(2))-methyltransferase RsmD